MGKANAAPPVRAAEKRRAEQHASQHFRHHLRLPETHRDGAHEPAEQENDGKLKKKLNDEMQVVRWSGDVAWLLQAAGTLAEQN